MSKSLTARPNMSGSQKRFIQAEIKDAITGRLALLDGEEGDNLEKDIEKVRKAVDDALKQFSAKVPKLLSTVATFALAAQSVRKTSACFKGDRWYYRDGDFDKWLPANQSNTDVATISVLTPMKDWTFAEAVVSVLNVSPDTPADTLGKLLKERGHTMTLMQVEEMVEATECGENTGMVTNGWGNFVFVENEDGSVSVALVYRDDARWNANLVSLVNGIRWHADYRLLVCNL